MRCLIFFFTFLFSGWSVEVGLVSYSNLFLLHPEMRYYHFGVNNFYKDNDLTQTLIDEKLKFLRDNLRELYIEYEASIEIARQSQWRKQLEISKTFAGDSSDWKSQAKMKQAQHQVEREYGKSYQNSQNELRTKVSNLLQSVFLKSQERRRRMLLISKQIQESIEDVRLEKSLDFVARRSDKLNLPVKWEPNLDVKSLSLSLDQLQDDYLRRFLNKENNGVSLQLLRASEHSQKDIKLAMFHNVNAGLLKKYLQKHRQLIPNRSLLGRVSDITVEVLLKIYKKNGYGEDRFIVLSDVLATVTD